MSLFFLLFHTIGVNIAPIALADGNSNGIHWLSWEEAEDLLNEKPKKLFINIYTNWCGYCKKMDRTTFMDSSVVQYINQHFYAIKLDAEMLGEIEFRGTTFGPLKPGKRAVHSLAYSLLEGRMQYPSYIMMDEKYNRIAISPGFKPATDLIKELRFAAEEKYLEMSWQDYFKTN